MVMAMSKLLILLVNYYIVIVFTYLQLTRGLVTGVLCAVYLSNFLASSFSQYFPFPSH